MSTARWAFLVVWCCLCAMACSGEPRPPSEPAPEPVAPPPTAAPEPPATAQVDAERPENLEPTPQELPVREDFEEEVALQVTLANYRAELDKLEKELEARE